MKVLILGDVHGDTHAVINVINKSKHIDYSKIVQVGDFGLWDHLEKGVKFLDDINVTLSHFGRTLYAIGGNHENWDHWNWHIENGPKDNDGFTILRSHIMLAPRIHSWTWEGRKMLAVAGAASVDRGHRQREMRMGATASWWPQEQITDEEIDSIPNEQVDFMFSHDCSNATPWGFTLIPDHDSQIHRQRIDRALKIAMPSMHFHGHMHRKYVWENRLSGDHYCSTYGLDCDGTWDNWGILNLHEYRFSLQGK